MDSVRQHTTSVFRKKLLGVIGDTIPNTTDYSDADIADIIATEIDKGIVNYMLNKRTTDFDKEMYLSRARMLMWNLVPNKSVNNPHLLTRLLAREITVQELVETMTHRQMYPERYIQVDIELEQEFQHKFGIVDPETLPDGAFKCGKCKSMKTSYYEIQLRACDEASTVFIRCHACNNKWRIG